MDAVSPPALSIGVKGDKHLPRIHASTHCTMRTSCKFQSSFWLAESGNQMGFAPALTAPLYAPRPKKKSCFMIPFGCGYFWTMAT